jgi:hypothetical protein
MSTRKITDRRTENFFPTIRSIFVFKALKNRRRVKISYIGCQDFKWVQLLKLKDKIVKYKNLVLINREKNLYLESAMFILLPAGDLLQLKPSPFHHTLFEFFSDSPMIMVQSCNIGP